MKTEYIEPNQDCINDNASSYVQNDDLYTVVQEAEEEEEKELRITPYHETAVIPRDTMQFDEVYEIVRCIKSANQTGGMFETLYVRHRSTGRFYNAKKIDK